MVLAIACVSADDVCGGRRVHSGALSDPGGPIEDFAGCNVVHPLVIMFVAVDVTTKGVKGGLGQ